MESLKLVTVTSAKFPENPEVSNLSFTFKSSSDSIMLNLGESKEISGDIINLELNSNILNLTSPLSIPENEEFELHLDEGVTLKILSQSVHKKSPSNLSIPSLVPHAVSSCDYIKKLQEVEGEEREISTLLMHSKMKAPACYRDYFESSPTTAAKKSPLKKKTLDPEGFAQVPDFQFSSYFDTNLENISSSEAMLLQHAAFGLISKRDSLKPDVEEYELTQEIIYEFDSPIKNLTESLEESKTEFEREQKDIGVVEQRIASETKEIDLNVEKLEQENEKLRREIELIREQIREQNEVNTNERNQESLSETQQLRRQLEDLQHDIKGLESQYEQLEKDFGRSFPEQELARAINEKVMRLGELQRMVTVRDSALQEGLLLQAELAELEALKAIQDDRELTISRYHEETAAFESTNKHINLQLKEIIGESEENLRSSEQELIDVEESQKPLESQIEQRKQVLAEKLQVNQEAKGKVEEVVKGNSNLAIILEKEQQILNEFLSLRPEFLGSVLSQSGLMHEIENLSNSLLKVANNSITSGRLIRRTEDMVEEQELQQLSMFKLISLIKETKPAYIAVQNDSVDMALAKYLKARHKTLDIAFKRLEKEKYGFGSMRVEIKLEDDLAVLLDNKKLTIEEFLEAFTQAEKEKNLKRTSSKISEKAKDPRPSSKSGKAPLIPLGQILKRGK